jgi:hypothetical protein
MPCIKSLRLPFALILDFAILAPITVSINICFAFLIEAQFHTRLSSFSETIFLLMKNNGLYIALKRHHLYNEIKTYKSSCNFIKF